MVSFKRLLLYPPGSSPWYPLDSRLGGPSAGVKTAEKGKISWSCRESNPNSFAVLPIAIQTELFRLLQENKFHWVIQIIERSLQLIVNTRVFQTPTKNYPLKFSKIEQWICLSMIVMFNALCIEVMFGKNLRGFSPPGNYTDRATAACRRS
jgi:hypothetical protein